MVSTCARNSFWILQKCKSRSKRTSQPIKDYNQKYSPTKNTGSTWAFLIVQIKPIKTVQILDLSTNDGLWSILGTPIAYPTSKFHYVRCFTCRHWPSSMIYPFSRVSTILTTVINGCLKKSPWLIRSVPLKRPLKNNLVSHTINLLPLIN